MLSLAVYKLFNALLCFGNERYYWNGESVLNGLGMALNGIATMLYIIDILYYTVMIGELGW